MQICQYNETECKKNIISLNKWQFSFLKHLNETKKQEHDFDKIREYVKTHSIKETIKKFNITKHALIKNNIYSKHTIKRLSCPYELTQEQQEIINGNLLGDGSLGHMKGINYNSKFQIGQKSYNIKYIEYLHDVYKPFSCKIIHSKQRKISHVNGKINHDIENWNGEYTYHSKFSTISHHIFTELRKKWYQNPYASSLKIVPRDLKLTWLTAAIWMCDDGSNCVTVRPSQKSTIPNREMVLYTNGFLEEDVIFLTEILYRDLGIKSNIKRQGKDKNQLVIAIYGDEQEKFINGIKQYIPFDCFQHKTRTFERPLPKNKKVKKESILIEKKISDNHFQKELDFF